MIEGSDADSFAYSLSNFEEVVFPCLEAVGARSLLEIGPFRGVTTRDLLDWAEGRDCSVTAVDPTPPAELLELESKRPELELIRETSLEALRHVPVADVTILDGDHNYYTVSHELRLIRERAPRARMPLLLLHDVGWPLGRRDAYEAPEQVPEEHRQPIARDAGLSPGEQGVVNGGLFYSHVAKREGGPRNGVLTAADDFIAEHDDLSMAVIPGFFGLGVIWHDGAPWADRVREVVAPWDGNPVLQRLEDNRLLHLIARLDLDAELDRERARAHRPKPASEGRSAGPGGRWRSLFARRGPG